MLKQRKRTKMLLENLDLISDTDWQGSGDNRELLDSLKRAVRYAAEHELTTRQKKCFELHYEQGQKQVDIARQLGVHPSVVSRCLQGARDRINRYARYSAVPYNGRPL